MEIKMHVFEILGWQRSDREGILLYICLHTAREVNKNYKMIIFRKRRYWNIRCRVYKFEYVVKLTDSYTYLK